MSLEKLPAEETKENLAQEQGAVVVQMPSRGNEKQSKEKDQARIVELQNELAGSGKQEEPIVDIEFLKESLAVYKRMAKDHNINPDTIISDNGVITSKVHRFNFPNLKSPTKDQDLYLGMLGGMASSVGIPLSANFSVENIISLIESRIAVSEDLKQAA